MTTPEEIARVIARLRKSAQTASEVSWMIANSKTDRNAEAEGVTIPPGQGYQGQSPEQTFEWRVADLIEAIRPSPAAGTLTAADIDKLQSDSEDYIAEVIGATREFNDGKAAMREWFLNRLRYRLPPSRPPVRT